MMRTVAKLLAIAVAGMGLFAGPVLAQKAPDAAAPADAGGKPDARRNLLRFLTTSDFPPFNYADEDGQLTGFNVDFARAICVELEVSCDIRAIAWDDLLPALDHGDGDAVIASIAVTPGTVVQADFTRRYYFMTAHFAVRKAGPKIEISPVGLEARKVAVVAGSAHAAYLKVFFPDTLSVTYPTADAARDALAKGEADALFGDGLGLAFWVNGTSSKSCCELSGGAYADERYFGDGMAVAVRKGDVILQRQIDSAIGRIRTSSRYEEMLSRYFPVRLF